jgi:hypothetical protein
MAEAIPTPHCAKVFCARKTLRVFLIGHKKPSFTAGTLNDICHGFYSRIFFDKGCWYKLNVFVYNLRRFLYGNEQKAIFYFQNGADLSIYI